MARLLSVLQAQGLSEPIADFVAHVLDAFPPSVAVGLASVPPALSFASGPARPNDKLLEPLTERELEILSYLGTDLSTPAIADALYVAASTVRTHVKSIYAKLAVHTRDEAVARAQSLGLM